MKTIAVYGSLRKGFYNHGWLDGAKSVGESMVKGFMYMTKAGFPRLYIEHPLGETTEPSEYKVELYEVDDNMFERLYSMEHSADYIARVVDFNGVKAYVFVSNVNIDRLKEEKPIKEYYSHYYSDYMFSN